LFFLVSKNWLFGFPGKSVGPCIVSVRVAFAATRH